MSRTAALFRATIAVIASVALAGCNTAEAPLSEDDVKALGPAECPAGALVGVGSSTPRAPLDEVSAAYGERCAYRSSITYETFGVNQGLALFAEEEADWIGSDTPLTDDQVARAATQCTAGQIWSLPLIAAPIAFAVNVMGVSELTLSSDVLGRILDGSITEWDDQAITDLNPGIKLPSETITVVGRSDANGLTAEVSRFLADSGTWPADRVGPEWRGVGEQQPSTPDVMRALRGTANSIGYAEVSAARANDLTIVRLDAGAGPVEPTAESAAAGLAQADISETSTGPRIVPVYSQPQPNAYPLHVLSYQSLCSTRATPGPQATLLQDFLGFLASDPQQEALAPLGFTPLPEPVRATLRTSIGQIE